tara:strand:- start:1168 stop:1419 length:252 start_codon:yes stop_codon:yes gene_type:complete
VIHVIGEQFLPHVIPMQVRWDNLDRICILHKHFSAASPDGISMDHAKFVELGRHGRRLITPMPGYSTHCDHLRSPTVDWEKYL